MSEENKKPEENKTPQEVDAYGGAYPEVEAVDHVDILEGEVKAETVGELGSVVGASTLYESSNALLQKSYFRGAGQNIVATGNNPGTIRGIGTPANPVPMNHYYKATNLHITIKATAAAPAIGNTTARVQLFGDRIPLFATEFELGGFQNTTLVISKNIPLNIIIAHNMRMGVGVVAFYVGGGAGSSLNVGAFVQGYLKPTNLPLAQGVNDTPAGADLQNLWVEYLTW